MDIYPSILEKSPSKALDFIGRTAHLFSHFQIDIADGIFVDNSTYSTEELAKIVEDTTPELSADTTFEFHLMVEDFPKSIEALDTITQYLPISLVFVHYQPAIRWLKTDDIPLHEKLHSTFPYQFGLSLNPEVEIEPHFDVLKHFDTIQLMTIKPGAQGRPFILEILDKISTLKAKGYEGRIILDGGMNAKTLPEVLKQKHWPDAVCPGSYLSEDTEEHLTFLQNLVLKAQDARHSID